MSLSWKVHKVHRIHLKPDKLIHKFEKWQNLSTHTKKQQHKTEIFCSKKIIEIDASCRPLSIFHLSHFLCSHRFGFVRLRHLNRKRVSFGWMTVIAAGSCRLLTYTSTHTHIYLHVAKHRSNNIVCKHTIRIAMQNGKSNSHQLEMWRCIVFESEQMKMV